MEKKEGKAYLENLRKEVNQLKDVIDGKDLQVLQLENELVDVTIPSMAIFLTCTLLLEMQLELMSYVKKNGSNARLEASEERLKNLLLYNRQLDKISETNYKLKHMNRELHTNYQILRIENKKLKEQLKNVIDAHEL